LKRPRIGVTGPDRGGAAAWIMTALAVLRAGGVPRRITPARPGDGEALDGLVLGGGADVDPSLYGAVAEEVSRVAEASREAVKARGTPWTSRLWAPGVFVLRRLLSRHLSASGLDPARDELEQRLLARAAERGVPVLGICRGAQLMNVFLGGTLYRDLSDFYEETPQIRTVLPRKIVVVEPDSRLGRALGATRCHVNALHEQAVRTLGEGLRVVARESTGVVQGIEREGHPFWIGVQWHPEYIPQHARQRAVFEALVRVARELAAAAPGARGARAPARAAAASPIYPAKIDSPTLNHG
jgi:putative glutamine amidotransferase